MRVAVFRDGCWCCVMVGWLVEEKDRDSQNKMKKSRAAWQAGETP